MSIVIQLFNGSPKKKRGEKMAGLILTRDPQLGFRMKVQALPTRREIHRLVSDCPLAITEQTLLWLQRHKWQWRLHPNSLDVRELLKQVKTYTELLPPEHIAEACDLLLSNFRAKGGNQQPTQRVTDQAMPQQRMEPSAAQMKEQMILMQRQMMAMQQQMQSGQVAQAQPEVPSDPIAAKLQKTQQRHAERMAHVNAVVEQNERKRQFQEESANNIEDIVAEVDSLVEEDLSEAIEIEVPEFFKKPQDAWDWAIELGIYEDAEEAKGEYESLKKEEKPSNAKEMAKLWTDTCLEIYELINEMESEEDSNAEG